MTSCLTLKQVKGFECTGSDESHVWKHLHKEVPKMFNCQGVCAEHYSHDMVGYHDHINLGLGKEAYDLTTYNEFVNDIVRVYDSCKKDGRC